MLLPRLSALSEICWIQKEQKNFVDFSERLDKQYLRYDKIDVNYRVPQPIVSDTIVIKKDEKISIGNPSRITEIRYTLDGSDPDKTSKLYVKPFKLYSKTLLKTRCFTKSAKKSSIVTSFIDFK